QGILDAGNGRGQYRLAGGQGLEHDIWKALETRGEDEAVGAGENRIWIGLEAPEPDPIDETQGLRLSIEAASLGTGAQYMKGKVAPFETANGIEKDIEALGRRQAPDAHQIDPVRVHRDFGRLGRFASHLCDIHRIGDGAMRQMAQPQSLREGPFHRFRLV